MVTKNNKRSLSKVQQKQSLANPQNSNAIQPAEPKSRQDQYLAMVSMAIEQGKLEEADRAMQMMRDFEADEARKAYADALAKFTGDCPPINKDGRVYFVSKNPGGPTTDYRHETLDGIMNTIKDTLSDCGLSPTFRSNLESGILVITCRITHSQGHFEETSLPAPPDTSGNKNNIQAIGSSITYLQRYTLKLMLGLSAGYDNDAVTPPEVEPSELITEEQVLEIDAFVLDNDIDGSYQRILNDIGAKNTSELWAINFLNVKNQIEQAAKAKEKQQ